MWESSGKKLGYAMNIPDTWRLERRRSESTCQSCQQRRWVHLRLWCYDTVSKTEKFKYSMWSQQRGGNYFLSVSSNKKPSESDRRSWSWNGTPWDIEPSTRRHHLLAISFWRHTTSKWHVGRRDNKFYFIIIIFIYTHSLCSACVPFTAH